MNKKQVYVALGIYLVILSITPVYPSHTTMSTEEIIKLLHSTQESQPDDKELVFKSACNGQRIELIQALFDNFTFSQETKNMELFGATIQGHTPLVKILLNNGADQGSREVTSDESSALLIAASKGYLEIVELLLEQKHDLINVKNILESTPLIMACAHGYYNIAKLLLDKGADQSLTTNDGDTPLIAAANKGHKDIVQLLLNQSTDQINAQTVYGETALMLALDKKHFDIAELLLDLDADPGIQNEDGNNPVMGILAVKHWGLLNKVISQARYRNLFTLKNNMGISPFDVLLSWGKNKGISKPIFKRFKEYVGNYKNDLSEEKIEEAIKYLLNPPPREEKKKKPSAPATKKKKKKKKKGKAFKPAQEMAPEGSKESFQHLTDPTDSSVDYAKELLKKLEEEKSEFSVYLTKALSQWQREPKEQLKRDGYFLPKTPRGAILKRLNSECGAHQAQQIVINAHSLIPHYIIKYLVEHPINPKTTPNETKMSLPLIIVTSEKQLEGTYELFFKKITKHEIVVFHSLFKDHRYKYLLTQLPASTLGKESFKELETSSKEEDKKQSEVKRENSWKHVSRWSVEDTLREITFTDNRNGTTYTISKTQ